MNYIMRNRRPYIFFRRNLQMATYEIRSDGVAVITVNNPPVNALSNHVLKSLITTCEIVDVREISCLFCEFMIMN